MLVTSQWLIQTTEIFYSFFDVYLAPHFEKGSTTHDSVYKVSATRIASDYRIIWCEGWNAVASVTLRYLVTVGCKNVGVFKKDVAETCD